MVQSDPAESANHVKTFFAVASMGKRRWYWVVWPSLEGPGLRPATQHLADGYERSKAEAVDRALAVAGDDGEWVAAKHARAYHRWLRRQASGHEAMATPAITEYLYEDVLDAATRGWYSVPHRIVRKTRDHVYVERRRYDPQRPAESWLEASATFRLDRAMLDRHGYALLPLTEDVSDPFLFASPYVERATRSAGSIEYLLVLGLVWPCTVAEVKAAYRGLAMSVHPDRGGDHERFLALRSAYEKAMLLCQHAA